MTPIDIVRPAGNYRSFEREATLSRQRYTLVFEPSGRGPGDGDPYALAAYEAAGGEWGGWWLSIRSVTAEVLIRGIRLVASSKDSPVDLLGHHRTLSPDLPPRPLYLFAASDPPTKDLARATLWYDD